MSDVERLERTVTELRDELKVKRGDVVPAHMVAAVTPSAVAEERANNWIHFHPETFCHLCGRRNITSWFVANEIWNATDLDGATIVCPVCFTERSGVVAWELRPSS